MGTKISCWHRIFSPPSRKHLGWMPDARYYCGVMARAALPRCLGRLLGLRFTVNNAELLAQILIGMAGRILSSRRTELRRDCFAINLLAADCASVCWVHLGTRRALVLCCARGPEAIWGRPERFTGERVTGRRIAPRSS